MGKIQKRWKIGDAVVTGFSVKSTTHTVTEVCACDVCDGGQLVSVAPQVPNTSDPEAWLNAGWFLSNDSVI